MKRAYLLAHPAGHSLSPVMHNAAFAQLGLDATYSALDVTSEQLPDVMARLREGESYGANVTVPHKLTVTPFMDELTDAARAVGAVNTVINRDGRLVGDNTDGVGFIRGLIEDADTEPRAKRAVLLGAGGAGRAVAYALLNAGVDRLQIFNRTQEKAEALGLEFSTYGDAETVDFRGLETAVRGADLLVNTTSVGLEHEGIDPDLSPLPPGLLPNQGMVCDLIYRPEKTRLLKDAEGEGLKTQNGVPMLVYQGAASFRAWTGRDAPVGVMTDAVQEALRQPR